MEDLWTGWYAPLTNLCNVPLLIALSCLRWNKSIVWHFEVMYWLVVELTRQLMNLFGYKKVHLRDRCYIVS